MSHPILNTIDQIIESRKQDAAQFQSMASSMLAEISNIQNALDLKKVNEELAEASSDDEEECIHWEHDHGVCMECGEDITESLAGAAEAYFEGDR